MSETQLFAISAACAVLVLISLIWAKDKSQLWRKIMYLAMCGFAITAMLYWLNGYTIPDLHPTECFATTTAFMLLGITVSYYFDLKAPVVIPDAIRLEMDSHTDAAIRLARYETEQNAARKTVRQRGLRAALAGSLLIGFAYLIVRSYGLAENMNGQQESLSKVLFRLVTEVHSVGQKLDTVATRVERNGTRIGKLEARNRLADKRDSLYRLRSLANQNQMMGNQKKALKVLAPKRQPTPTPEPIKPKEKRRNWLDDLFSHRDPESDSLPTRRR